MSGKGKYTAETGFGDLSRSQLMSRVRSRANRTTELRVLTLLRQYRIVGWRRNYKLLGKPDFVWPGVRLALFVDGCFWHGHECGRNLTPKNNAEFWEEKIQKTRSRDAAFRRSLRHQGWAVVSVWECELARTPAACTKKIQAALARRSNGVSFKRLHSRTRDSLIQQPVEER